MSGFVPVLPNNRHAVLPPTSQITVPFCAIARILRPGAQTPLTRVGTCVGLISVSPTALVPMSVAVMLLSKVATGPTALGGILVPVTILGGNVRTFNAYGTALSF